MFVIPPDGDCPYEALLGWNGSWDVIEIEGFDFRSIMDLPDWWEVALVIAKKIHCDGELILDLINRAEDASSEIDGAFHAGFLASEDYMEPYCDGEPPTLQQLRNLIAKRQFAATNRQAKKRLIAERRKEFAASRSALALTLMDRGHAYACVSCAACDDLTIDHVWPLSRGGDDGIENLQFLCRSCNSSKGAK